MLEGEDNGVFVASKLHGEECKKAMFTFPLIKGRWFVSSCPPCEGGRNMHFWLLLTSRSRINISVSIISFHVNFTFYSATCAPKNANFGLERKIRAV